MVIVAAPVASGLTSSGKKLAAVPVVPHSSEASINAPAPAARGLAVTDTIRA